MGAGDGVVVLGLVWGVGVWARVCVGAMLESERLEVGAWGVACGVLVSCEWGVFCKWVFCKRGVFCDGGGFCGRGVFCVVFDALFDAVFGIKHASCEPNSGENPTRCPSHSRIQNSPKGVLQGWESMGRCGFCSIA